MTNSPELTDDFKALFEAILDFEDEDVNEEVDRLLAAGKTPLSISEAARMAITEIGVLFETKEIFLAELIMAGELFKDIMEKIGFTPEALRKAAGEMKGKVLIGTVEGDIHDIGKNIVNTVLATNFYEIIDLGVDVPASKFIEAIKTHQPQVVALSGLLTAAYDSMKNIVEAFTAAGIRDQFKVVIGGGAINQSVCDLVGADAFGDSAVSAVTLAEKFCRR